MPRLTKKSRRSNSKTRKQNGGLGNWLSDLTADEYRNLYKSEDKKKRKELLKANFAFFTGVMALVVTKNKLDYPPLGPKHATTQEIQEEKLRVLFKAMSEWDELSVPGADMHNPLFIKGSMNDEIFGHNKDRAYPLGGHGIRQQALLVARAGVGSIGRAAVDSYNVGKFVIGKSSKEEPVVEQPVAEQPTKQANWMPSFM
jgi:hypothetical protein